MFWVCADVSLLGFFDVVVWEWEANWISLILLLAGFNLSNLTHWPLSRDFIFLLRCLYFSLLFSTKSWEVIWRVLGACSTYVYIYALFGWMGFRSGRVWNRYWLSWKRDKNPLRSLRRPNTRLLNPNSNSLVHGTRTTIKRSNTPRKTK